MFPTVIYIIAGFNGNKRGLTASTRDYSKNDFVLTVAPHKNKLTFFQWGDDRDGLINNASYGCNKNIAKSRRLNCGALIQNDGWEIKEDYPW